MVHLKPSFSRRFSGSFEAFPDVFLVLRSSFLEVFVSFESIFYGQLLGSFEAIFFLYLSLLAEFFDLTRVEVSDEKIKQFLCDIYASSEKRYKLSYCYIDKIKSQKGLA